MPDGMRVAVIGGGPGGLFAGRLLKLARPGWRVDVFERNPAGSVYGFGIGLGGQVLGSIQRADPVLHDDLMGLGVGRDSSQRMVSPDGISEWQWGGWRTLAIARAALLAVLRARAEQAGVNVSFETDVSYDEVAGADIVIAADGANSATRARFAASFRPSIRPGRLKTIWLGARADPPIDKSMFAVRTNEHGTWALHAYPYGPSPAPGTSGMATLVIETDPMTWERAGLRAGTEASERSGTPDLVSRDYLSGLYADYLGGAELLMSNSRWFTFDMIKNASWSAGHTVLLGDAAHTAHPSIGSGTRMAMEDAVALGDAFAAHGDHVSAAFRAYEGERRPKVAQLQRAALPSQRWWETLDERIGLGPDRLAMHYISRTGFYPLGRFAERDAGFVTRIVRDFRTRHAGPDAAAAAGPDVVSGELDVLRTPLVTGALSLRNRISTRVGGIDQLERLARDPSSSPGLAVLEVGRPAELIERETEAVRIKELTASGPFAVAVSVPADADRTVIERLVACGVAVIETQLPPGIPSPAALTAAARAISSWQSLPAGVILRLPGIPADPDSADLTDLARRIAALDARVEIIDVEFGHNAADHADLPFQLADRFRAAGGPAVMTSMPALDADRIATALVCGRADLVSVPFEAVLEATR
jgi:2-polyprenyl-6-methoxyphenol hydroxylase-like FAD-dependent oxidoreductase